MALTLYVETNFPLAIAEGRDLAATSLLDDSKSQIKLIMPSICVMEAFSVWNAKKKHKNTLVATLDAHIKEVNRDRVSPRAKSLAGHLEQSLLETENLFDDTKFRLKDAILRLFVSAEFIHINRDIINEAIATEFIDDPTDNLILCCILRHALENPEGHKSFFSSNRNDFGHPEIRRTLGDAGVKYFPRIEDALGWLHSRDVV